MPDLIEMIVFKVFTSWRGPNTEADGKSAYNNVQVGGAPTREFRKEILQTMQVGERGPNTEGDEKSAYNNVQVGGAPTIENFKRNSTDNASWGSTK
ncbi:nitrogen regulation protein NIFR3 [Staphylococcus aureus]|nr:nitrogen regulation protein NIFR3 [Staphylococcus aureus]